MHRVALVVFTRDLRVNDHPALSATASGAGRVVPLFVFDDAILAGSFNRPNRTGFLLDSLTDLDVALQALGARLVVRRGDWVDTVVDVARQVGATSIHVSTDVSSYARRRLARLQSVASRERIALVEHPGTTIVPAGAVTPAGGDHYQVFTPYFRRWQELPRRHRSAAPTSLRLPDELDAGALPVLADVVQGERSPSTMRGGASEARRRLSAWVGNGLANYDDRHDDLPGDATSRLSASLHFGCLSPLEVLDAVRDRPGAEPFVRQLGWRDFFAQLLAARPDAAWSDYRPRGDVWRDDPAALEAWKAGRTGFPVVDAGMRQLAAEGFMHNRARMIVASFLTKDLGIDWRAGARHFLDLLVDGDLAQNNLNWQWVAGTGTDSNPHRVFNPTVQGTRFDPLGEYVRRWVPELAALRGTATHDPPPEVRRAYGYPAPIVDHRQAIAAYRDRLSPPRRPR